MKRFLLLTTFLTLIFNYGKSQAPLPPVYAIDVDTAAYTVLPDSYWQMMPDRDGYMSFAQAQHLTPFSNTDRKVDYRYHVYWVRFRLANAMDRDAHIAFPGNAAQVDLYTQLNHGRWEHQMNGTMVRWSHRAGLKRINAFTVTIPPGDTLTAYKRIYWDYVAFQPDSIRAAYVPAGKLIEEDYVRDDSHFMTSMEAAFILGLFVLSMIISFYFFLVVREREFLYFSLYLLLVVSYTVPTLNDVFLREHPYFLLYLYIVGNSLAGFALIHALRPFLKIPKRFPKWDKVLVVFSFLLVICLLSSHFIPSVLHVDLSKASHLMYNWSMLSYGVVILITLSLYIRFHDRATKLMITAFVPIFFLLIVSYLEAVLMGLYYPRFGEPAVSGYVNSFNKAAFVIVIVTYLWMIGLFDWVMFLRFANIRRGFIQQKEVDRLKSRFFANISHEFRTPLTLIIGPLEDVMRGGDRSKLLSLVPEMHRNSRRLLQLINQLLDLSRLDSKDYHIHTVREDVIPFVRQIVHSFSSLAERRNIDLELKEDPDLSIAFDIEDTSFYFDEDIMEKVLTNLLSNAFKFTPEGGEIKVSLSLHEDQKRYLEMKVEDNGEGISAEKLPFIFDRFYQADDSVRRKHEGSGIGLSLVKELVELHHGRITVSSRLHQGTVFSCLFPLNEKIGEVSKEGGGRSAPLMKEWDMEEGGKEEERGMGEQLEGDKPLILVVEDHHDVRKYIVEKLRDDYAILEAGNGREGLTTAMERIPDLIVSDVMMPEMDGFELCQMLKTEDLTCHIPVILLTARAEDSDKMAGLETGADAYVVKPFNAQELLIRVKHLIALRHRMRVKFSGQLLVKPSEITTTSRDRGFMQKLSSVVEQHMEDGLFSVEQLAGELNMSTAQLYRKLKALIDQSAQQYIRSIRMQRALDLLKSDWGTVAEIAWKVGFEDPNYFSKVFKKYFGFSPSEKEKFGE